MSLNVALVATDQQDHLKTILNRTGLAVRAPADVESLVDKGPGSGTLCLVIALPGLTGLELLEKLRARHVETPAILIVDPDCTLPSGRLAEACVLDTLAAPAQTRDLLGWIECVCVTSMILARERQLQASTRRRYGRDLRRVA